VSTQRSRSAERDRRDEEGPDDGGHDDVHTEGNVVSLEPAPEGTSVLVTIALGPGGRERLIVQVPCSPQGCPDIRVGDYVEADGYQNGVGDPNTYFVAADEITVWRNGQEMR
jgi:hypothetical protein